MAEVKWIKLNVDMFDDEKIKIIQAMPDGDSLLLVRIKLILLAGKTNDSGYIYIADNIPYTDEMLAVIMNKPISIIRLAINTFENLQMIENDTKGIYLVNFEKYQNLDKLEKIKEQRKEINARYYEKQKALKSKTSCKTSCKTQQDTTDIDIDIDIDKDIDSSTNKEINNNNCTSTNIGTSCPAKQDEGGDKIPYERIINYLNNKTKSKYQVSSNKTKSLIKARFNEGFKAEDFKKVIDVKVAEWKGTEREKYLRPETLFGTKFESYLNQKMNTTKTQNIKTESNVRLKTDEYDDYDFDEVLKKLSV